ncbi:hypothetical protein FRC12_003371 [Ceratobasidium sp. 428]|nr:hypothetical protein FRC12_003371 [Ceratobasidium sp. 428]
MSCSADDVTDYCMQITSNPDISGKGVRLAIYVQTFLSMCVASFLWDNEKAFRDTCRNSYIVSGSLIMATLAAWKTDQLSLFDALVTSMASFYHTVFRCFLIAKLMQLTTLMTAFVTVNGPYIRSLGLSINIASLVFTSFWCYWGLQVWANVQTFGLPSDLQGCTANQSTQFVYFGHSVSATSHGLQKFALFVFSVGALSALYALWTTSWWVKEYLVVGSEKAKQRAQEDLARWQHLRRQRGRTVTHVNRFGGLVGLIYMVVTIEQMVDRNPDANRSLRDWTFGQTLALIMLAQQILDGVSYVKETYRARGEARRLGFDGFQA